MPYIPVDPLDKPITQDVTFTARWGRQVGDLLNTDEHVSFVSGYNTGLFLPEKKLSRAEACSLFYKLLRSTDWEKKTFPDVKSDQWYAEAVETLAGLGILSGYEDGTFRPQQYITRAEAVTMVNRTIDRHPDADHLLDDMIVWPDNLETAWYYEQVQEATNSHEYTMNTDDEQNPYEIWTKLLPNRDWSELEKEWSDANDGAGSGEVV